MGTRCVLVALLLAHGLIVESKITQSGIPLISAVRQKRGIMNRDSVRKLQLQSMLKALEKEEENEPPENTVKRDLEDGGRVVNTDFTRLLGDHQLNWERANSPLDKRTKINSDQQEVVAAAERRENPFISRQKAPCKRRKRSSGERGEGVPSFNIYDELCEDAQPVEVVKVDKLVVENGVIRDQNIIERAMFAR